MYISIFSRFSVTNLFICSLLFFSACNRGGNYNPASQNPSPMVESIRPHYRVNGEDCLGKRVPFKFYEKNAQLFIPERYNNEVETNLIIHFHGMPQVVEFAICESKSKVLLTINGGSGSSGYEKIFKGNNSFEELLSRVLSELEINEFASITLCGWSAGYGAIRAIIPQYENRIDNVVLLDGIHTSYIPEKLVLNKGGELDSTNLDVFYQFAEKAKLGEKQMIITHTSIFPGTFASTTECTDYLIRKLELKRMALLKPGPVGMQQLGEVKAGNLLILSFAGNTAPDHVDHLHGLNYFIEKLNLPE